MGVGLRHIIKFGGDTIQFLTMGNLICSKLIEMFGFRASLQNYKLKKSVFGTQSFFFFPGSGLHCVVTIFFILTRLCASLFYLPLSSVLSLERESVISRLYSGTILTQGNLHSMSSP